MCISILIICTSCSFIKDSGGKIKENTDYIEVDDDKEQGTLEIIDNDISLSEDNVMTDDIDETLCLDIIMDLDINHLYITFLKGESVVEDPYEKGSWINAYFYKGLQDVSFDDSVIEFALIDLNGDLEEELVVNIHNDVDQLLEILSVTNGELVMLDLYESHSMRIGFDVYDNGVVRAGHSYDDQVNEYFSYDINGERKDIITFFKAYMSDSPLSYECYYLNGNREDKIALSTDEEYELIKGEYVGELLEYIDITEYVESLSNGS